MSKLFSFNPAEYSQHYKTRGYAYIPRGLHAEFHRALVSQVENHLEQSRLADFALGDKQQSLYEFPTGHDYLGELLDCVAAVTGLARAKLVLSERHIKAYEPGAAPQPLVHKDRYASEVSVGFSVSVPPGSRLVLYPHDDVSVNPFNSSAELRASLSPDQLPEQTLLGAEGVEIQDAPRDVLMFRGNAIWHHRLQPAGTTMLYLKLNTFHCDPLGEDPSSEGCRRLTQAALAGDDAALARLVPVLGRRVDYVHERFDRDWNPLRGVVLWGQRHLTLGAVEWRVLRAMDGRRTLGDILRQTAGEVAAEAVLAAARRLAACGALDLLSAPAVVAAGPLCQAGAAPLSPATAVETAAW